MEEDEYRSTYHEFNRIRCAFEKAILSRRCSCKHSHKFCIAEREGVSCQDQELQQRCMRFLEQVREKSRFIFRLIQPDEPLPHAKEIRVQLGSLNGLAKTLEIPIEDNEIADIDSLLNEADRRYSSLDAYPHEAMVRTIRETQGRRKRSRKP